MKRRILIFIGCAVLFVMGGGLGYLLRVPLPPVGVGQSKESPNEKWEAFAFSFDDGSILGPHRTYSEFWIRTKSAPPQMARRVTIEDTVIPAIDWRDEGSILWATNSSAVTFTFDGSRYTNFDWVTNGSTVTFTNVVGKMSLQMTLMVEP